MAWRTGFTRLDIEGDRIRSVPPSARCLTAPVNAIRAAASQPRVPVALDRGFTGSWTFDIEPAANGSRLTITERGRVSSPVFRLLARFVFGYEGAMRQYHNDLARRLGA